ncbi:MAG: heme-binding domain-containing protein [Bacteroidetes bacterium]|nr:heme-binding domain-containing protein [Bacteroidota bacterium]
MRRILIALGAVFALIQLIPVDRSNPPAVPENDFLVQTKAPENIAQIMKTACYDCHSNQTVYPWYSYIAPVSFWLKNHINEGRGELNFSEWNAMSAKEKSHAMKEAAEMVKEGEMPMNSYTWVHKDARLTIQQQEQLAAWFSQVRGGGAETEIESHRD